MQTTKDFSQTEKGVRVVERPPYQNNQRPGLDRPGTRSLEQDSVSVQKDSQMPINHTPAHVEGKSAVLEASWRRCCSFYWHL